MGLFAPAPVPMQRPTPMEMYLPDVALMKKKKHMTAVVDLKRTVEHILVEHKQDYAPGAVGIVQAVGPRARALMEMQPHDVADLSDETQAEYLTAAAFGLAAGQTEVATNLAPGAGRIHAYMHLVLTMASTSFEDALCSYLVRAGHYIARHDGRGIDELAAALTP